MLRLVFPGSVRHALTAADAAILSGVDVEVIDLRSIVPIDWETIGASLAKSRALLVVDEDYLGYGLSGELITGAIERFGLGSLDYVGRHGNPGIPMPAALSLEREIVPGTESILNAIVRAGAAK